MTFSNKTSALLEFRSGLALMVILLFLAALSGLMLHWYQNEIRYYLQSKAMLNQRMIYQELEGVLNKLLVELQQHPEADLRMDVQWDGSRLTPFVNWKSVSSIESIDSVNSRVAVDLEYIKESTSLPFHVLYDIESFKVSDFPWFNTTDSPTKEIPQNLVFQKDESKTISDNHPQFHFPPLEETAFDWIFPGDLSVEWNSQKLTWIENGKEKTLSLSSTQKVSIGVNGNLKLKVDFSKSLAGQRVFFAVMKDAVLQLSESPQRFSEETVKSFLHAKGDLILETSSLAKWVQVNIHLWAEGPSCLDFQNPPQEVYWKGSLACNVSRERFPSIPIRFLHQKASGMIPLNFQRRRLTFNGIKPK